MTGWIILLILMIVILSVSIILFFKASRRSPDRFLEDLDRFIGMHETADGNDSDGA